MNEWLSLLGEASICGSVMTLLVLAVRPLKKVARTALSLLWTTVLLRFLLPVRLSSPLSAYMLFVACSGSVSTHSVVVADTPSAAPVALIVWAVGALVAAAVFAVLHHRSARALRVAIPLHDEAVSALLGGLRVRVYTCESIATPLSVGVFRPRILLPACMDRSDVTLLRHALYHEAGHIRGKHNLIKLLAVAAACLQWMNPCVWIALALLPRDLELCCDEQVLRRIGGGERKGYALSLLRLAERGGVAAGCGFGRTAVHARIEGIARYRRRGRAARMGAVLLAAANVLLFAAMPTIQMTEMSDVMVSVVSDEMPSVEIATGTIVPTYVTVTSDAELAPGSLGMTREMTFIVTEKAD